MRHSAGSFGPMLAAVRSKPSRTLRAALVVMRLPAQLDRPGLRPLLRLLSPYPILVLTHWGRRSGKSYRTPLEVIDENSDRNERYVTPLMGKRSDWYRNVIANGPVEGRIRNEIFRFTWRQATQEEAQAALENYQQRHPRYTRFIMGTVARLNGLPDATPATIAEALPLLALRAVEPRT